MTTRAARVKLSATVAPDNFRYLTARVKTGKAGSLSEAVDEAVEHLRRSENRRRLAQATADYYESLSPKALAEEQSLAASLSKAAQRVDFDLE